MFDTEQLSHYPTQPGIYMMKDKTGEVLYVGKANNLRQRLKQYFFAHDDREMVPYLMEQVETIDTIVVGSPKEALLLEETLIKRHRPKYNVLLKDDRAYIGLRLTTQHEWPRLELMRFRGAPGEEEGETFGPYPHAMAARETLELLRKLFPLRQCSDEELARRTRPCLLYQIKRCVAPCVNLVSHEEYQYLVERVEQFLRGKDREVIEQIKEEMERAAANQEFERAAQMLKTLRQVEMTIEGQRVVADRPTDCDVVGLYREGAEVSIAVLQFRDGRLIGSERQNLSNVVEDDSDLLRHFVLQYYRSGIQLPKEILLPVELEEAQLIEEMLGTRLHTPSRGSKKKLLEIALENARAAWQQTRDRRSLREQQLLELQETCQLNNYPQRIECIDTSHLSGADAVAVVVSFFEGQKDTSHYRTYKLRETQRGDDYGALREVLTRRYGKAAELPDLLLIDGGKGQLGVAAQVFQELNIITVDLVAMAKEAGRHDRGLTAEQLYLREALEPVRLEKQSNLLFLLQQIRDEAHRFALSFHRKRRSKTGLQSSLDNIPGIGPVKRKRLLRHFGSVKRIREATDEQLLQVESITRRDVEALRRFFTFY
jgi:excinuclease ABC subunit C